MTNNNYHGLLLEIHVVTFLGQEKTSLWRNMPLACPQVPSSNTRLYGWLPGAWGIASISSASESGYNRRVLGLFISSATFGNLYQRFTIYQPWDILYLFLPYVFYLFLPYVFALWHLQPIWSIFNYCSFAPIHRLNEQFQKQVNSWTMIISYWWNHNKRTKKIELPAKWELFPFDDLHFICWQAFTQNGNSCQVSTFLKKWF